MKNKTQINTVSIRHGLTQIYTVVKSISLCPLCALWLKNSVAKRKGVTLVEMMVVITIAALMVGLTIPAANMLLNSFESESGAKSIISSALASARAIAAKEQRYAGIRFQKRYDPNNNILDTSQYIVFIISDPNIRPGVQGNLGCRAVEGIQPMKLPDSIGVMDSNAAGNSAIDSDSKISNNTTFTILFSPSGKLIIHILWVRNKNGVTNDSSMDDVFNSTINVNNNVGMFIQDESTAYIEQSRNSFIIYDTKKLKKTDQNLRIYINPYTGTIIN